MHAAIACSSKITQLSCCALDQLFDAFTLNRTCWCTRMQALGLWAWCMNSYACSCVRELFTAARGPIVQSRDVERSRKRAFYKLILEYFFAIKKHLQSQCCEGFGQFVSWTEAVQGQDIAELIKTTTGCVYSRYINEKAREKVAAWRRNTKKLC